MFNTKTRIAAAWSLVAIAASALTGCEGMPAEEYATTTLNGEVRMAAGPVPAGTLHFRLYVLESLEGDLQHPLEEIEDFVSDSPVFSHTFDYPLHKGDGLAIHAWADTDGDGIFCTPTARLDPSGLAYTPETPSGEISMVITLSENCRAANYFYPPAP
jgi:hypothetical protein